MRVPMWNSLQNEVTRESQRDCNKGVGDFCGYGRAHHYVRCFKHGDINGIILGTFMLVNVLTSFFGIIVFLFIFWKRLKDDYASSLIFTISFYILLGVMLGSAVTSRFFPTWFLWAVFLGAAAGVGFCIFRFKVRFYEILEAVIIGFLPWLSFIFLKDSVVNQAFSSFVAFLVVLILIYVFYYLDSHFREFTWYKSGKVGFAGLAALGLLSIVRSAASFIKVSMLSFNGKIDALASLSLGFICFILLYNLSRSRE